MSSRVLLLLSQPAKGSTSEQIKSLSFVEKRSVRLSEMSSLLDCVFANDMNGRE